MLLTGLVREPNQVLLLKHLKKGGELYQWGLMFLLMSFQIFTPKYLLSGIMQVVIGDLAQVDVIIIQLVQDSFSFKSMWFSSSGSSLRKITSRSRGVFVISQINESLATYGRVIYDFEQTLPSSHVTLSLGYMILAEA